MLNRRIRDDKDAHTPQTFNVRRLDAADAMMIGALVYFAILAGRGYL